jgi:hypothetical protein
MTLNSPHEEGRSGVDGNDTALSLSAPEGPRTPISHNVLEILR